jgi:hypothetical protein
MCLLALLFQWLYSPRLGLDRFLWVLILYTVGRTPWKRNQTVARSLPIHRATQTRNKYLQTYMLRVGFEHTTSVFERAKTAHALDYAATGSAAGPINVWSFLVWSEMWTRDLNKDVNIWLCDNMWRYHTSEHFDSGVLGYDTVQSSTWWSIEYSAPSALQHRSISNISTLKMVAVLYNRIHNSVLALARFNLCPNSLFRHVCADKSKVKPIDLINGSIQPLFHSGRLRIPRLCIWKFTFSGKWLRIDLYVCSDVKEEHAVSTFHSSSWDDLTN